MNETLAKKLFPKSEKREFQKIVYCENSQTKITNFGMQIFDNFPTKTIFNKLLRKFFDTVKQNRDNNIPPPLPVYT